MLEDEEGDFGPDEDDGGDGGDCAVLVVVVVVVIWHTISTATKQCAAPKVVRQDILPSAMHARYK